MISKFAQAIYNALVQLIHKTFFGSLQNFYFFIKILPSYERAGESEKNLTNTDENEELDLKCSIFNFCLPSPAEEIINY
jgi:hypothetical protein